MNNNLAIDKLVNIKQIQRVFKAFEEARLEARVVGGAVRDALLGKNITDIDFVTNATPDVSIRVLGTLGKTIEVGINYGTVVAIIDGSKVEVTTLREDVLTFGRKAEVKFGTNWETDASRRDFTINAMMLAADGVLYDYFSGLDDIVHRKVVFIGDPWKRISEDYLRILRFFRFRSAIGDTNVNSKAFSAIVQNCSNLDKLSPERKWLEVKGILELQGGVGAFKEMLEYGVLPYILPNVTHLNAFALLQKISNLGIYEIDKIQKIAVLAGNQDQTLNITAKFHLSNKDAKRLEQMVGASVVVKTANLFATQGQENIVRALLYKLGKENLIDSFIFAYCRLNNNQDYDNFSLFTKYIELFKTLKVPLFEITGQDLLNLGYCKGKYLGVVLKKLESEWLLSNFTLERHKLIEIARKNMILNII